MKIESLKALYNKDHESGTGIYSTYDWNRLKYIFELPLSGDILDAGCGNGALLHLLLDKEEVNSITGIDIHRNSRLIIPDGAHYQIDNVLNLSFSKAKFDTVICMEVLEHLEKKDLSKAIHNLRDTSKNLNIYTVPLNEPDPVWWHDKPGGHRQSFNEESIKTLFPNSIATIIKNHSVDWILICESKQNSFNDFKIISNEDFNITLDGS